MNGFCLYFIERTLMPFLRQDNAREHDAEDQQAPDKIGVSSGCHVSDSL
jgi:hypothetical protein